MIKVFYLTSGSVSPGIYSEVVTLQWNIPENCGGHPDLNPEWEVFQLLHSNHYIVGSTFGRWSIYTHIPSFTSVPVLIQNLEIILNVNVAVLQQRLCTRHVL